MAEKGDKKNLCEVEAKVERRLKQNRRNILLFIISIILIFTVALSTSIHVWKKYKQATEESIQIHLVILEVDKTHDHHLQHQTGKPHYEGLKDKQCANIEDDFRFDCHPENDSTQKTCEARGCCWAKPKKEYIRSNGSIGVPNCFFPTNFPGYYYVNSSKTPTGFTVFIERDTATWFGNDIKLLRIDIELGRNRVRTKIYDPNHKRYEIPYQLNPEKKDVHNQPRNYEIQVIPKPFSMKIYEKISKRLVSSVLPTFIYADQFIQVSSRIGKYVYGLGERKDSFLRSLDWQQFVMFSADQSPVENSNLYGSHPFMLNGEGTGMFMGTLVYNSNAVEVILQPAPAITYRTLGGVFDVVIFLGPSPREVIQQYQQAIGYPNMPPYWSLGFQLSRWGYKSANETRKVWQRTRDAGIPFDVQWNDIDYMDQKRDFTLDQQNFGELPALVDDIHKAGMHYVAIVDPALDTPKNSSDYPPFADALSRGILINDSNGNPFIGKVWSPNGAAWPDFTNPKTIDFWTDHLSDFHKLIPYDGIWIDMNEPSNFYDGLQTGCPSTTYDNPPYTPHIRGNKLSALTVCMSAKQHSGLHYDLHNLYGYTEAIATYQALQKIIPGKRPFIVSRSTFPGHGHYANHWSGDVWSTWHDLKASIPSMLDFNMFGIPMVGADICGFNGNTTTELCQRWMELGAFYPFSRNHNSIDTIDQDPVALGKDVVRASIFALNLRYTLLPYLYTLFYRAHVMGETVARPLFFEFPKDFNTYSIDTSFMWGPALLVIPVLAENQTTVDAYFPKGFWFLPLETDVKPIYTWGETVTIDAQLHVINIAIRGGFTLPLKFPANNTAESRKQGFQLLVALNIKGHSFGELYWDDGDSNDAIEKEKYNLISFETSDFELKSSVVKVGAKEELTELKLISVWGVPEKPTSVYVNKQNVTFYYNDVSKALTIPNLNINLAEPFTASWLLP